MTEVERIQSLEIKVAELQRTLAWVMRQLDLHYVEPHADSAIRDFIARGDLIGAIKAYREQTGASLVDAKTAVEALQESLKSEKPYR